MRERKSRDRFRVGQTVALVLNETTGHEQHNGKLTTVLAPQRYDDWKCGDPARPGFPRTIVAGWRYLVRDPGDGSEWPVAQCHLRAIYDGENASTWEKFAKKTGIDPRKAPSRRRRKEPANE